MDIQGVYRERNFLINGLKGFPTTQLSLLDLEVDNAHNGSQTLLKAITVTQSTV